MMSRVYRRFVSIGFSGKFLAQASDGDCRGMVMPEDRLLVSTDSHGILEFDLELELVRRTGLISRDLQGMCKFSDNVVLAVENQLSTVTVGVLIF